MSLLRTTISQLPKPSYIHYQTTTTILTSARVFHSSSPPLSSKAPPRKSPRVKSISQTPRSTAIPRSSNLRREDNAYDVEASLPPISLLKTAQVEGNLEVKPEKAMDFLREFSTRLNGGVHGEWEERLCAKHAISPLALFHLSTAIFTPNPTSTPNPAQTRLAKSLMVASYTQNCSLALYTIIYTALQNSTSISRNSEPLQHLKSVAASDEAEPIAMTLLGLVLRSQGKEREALGWFLKAVGWKDAEVDGPEGTDGPEQEQQGLTLAFEGANEALLAIGEIFAKLSTHNLPAAREAFRIAALELDDPQAYYRLATLLPVTDDRREGYLVKAAASGVGGALRELAVGGKVDGSSAKERWGMDREWALLAEESAGVKAVTGTASV